MSEKSKLLIKLDPYSIASINFSRKIDVYDLAQQFFEAGFKASGEGFNGEYGSDESDIQEAFAAFVESSLEVPA